MGMIARIRQLLGRPGTMEIDEGEHMVLYDLPADLAERAEMLRRGRELLAAMDRAAELAEARKAQIG